MKQLASFAIAAAALGACAGDDGVTITMTASAEAPAYGDAPFPTDARPRGRSPRRDRGARRRSSPAHADLVAAHLAALDGFGAAAARRVLRRRRARSDLGPGTHDVDGDRGARRRRSRRRRSAAAWSRWTGATTPSATCSRARRRAASVLREGTRYAAFVTTAIRDADGDRRRAAPSATLGGARALAHHRRGAAPSSTRRRDSIAGLAVFTTQHATAPLVAAREALLAAPPPDARVRDPALVFRGTTALDRDPRRGDARDRRTARRPRALGQRQPDRHRARPRRRGRDRHDDDRAVPPRRHADRSARRRDVRRPDHRRVVAIDRSR